MHAQDHRGGAVGKEGSREDASITRDLEVRTRRRQPNRPVRIEHVLRVEVLLLPLDVVRRPHDVDEHDPLHLLGGQELREEHAEVAKAGAQVEDHDLGRSLGKVEGLNGRACACNHRRDLGQLLGQPPATTDASPQGLPLPKPRAPPRSDVAALIQKGAVRGVHGRRAKILA